METFVLFTFATTVSMKEVEETLHLARLAVDSLFGVDRVQLEARVHVDATARTVEIDTAGDVGRNLALVFGGYVRREFGENAVEMQRISRGGRQTVEAVA